MKRFISTMRIVIIALIGLASVVQSSVSSFASEAGILWRNTHADINGAAASDNWFYFMQGGHFSASRIALVHNRWTPYQGDFNGDGMTDILWQDASSGQNWLYLLNKNNIILSKALNRVGHEWKVAGVGDFNADGVDDLLWRNRLTGDVWLYTFFAGNVASSGLVNKVGDPYWRVSGVGDFNGDGHDDILWHHLKSGVLYIYQMVQGKLQSTRKLATVGADWRLASISDIDNNGTDDLIWRHYLTGRNWRYRIDNFSISDSSQLNLVESPHWQIASSGDYDGDGDDDLLWRHSISGKNYIHFIEQGVVEQVRYLNTVPMDWLVHSDQTTGALELNHGLSGTVFMGAASDGWLLDLTTGRYRRIPGVDWYGENKGEGKDYPALAIFSVYPQLPSGSRFVQKVDNCEKQWNDALAPWWDCLVIHEKDGKPTMQAQIDDDILLTPKLSRDGEHIAIIYEDAQATGTRFLVFLDTQFTVTNAITLPSGPVRAFDWSSQGEVFLAIDQQIYRARQSEPALVTIASFDSGEGFPDAISVDPSGEHIAFLLVTDETSVSQTATPWIIAASGEGVAQIARTMSGIRPSFEHPIWSPCGNWLLIQHGHVAASFPDDNPGIAGGLYAFWSSQTGYVLGSDEVGIVPITSYWAMTSGSLSGGLVSDFYAPNGNIAWLP